MRTKGKTHITLHVQGRNNEPITTLFRVADIEKARPMTKWERELDEIPNTYQSRVFMKNSSVWEIVTESVEDVAQLMEGEPDPGLKRIEEKLGEILKELQRQSHVFMENSRNLSE